MKSISSKLTFPYKFILPPVLIIIGVGIIGLAIYFLVVPEELDLIIFQFAFFTIYVAIIYPVFKVLIKIRNIKYDKDFIYFNGGKRIKISLECITKVQRHLFFFYKISVIDSKGFQSIYYFLPHILEVFDAIGGEPKSISKLKDIIGE